MAALGVESVYARLRSVGFEEAVVLATCNRFEVYLGRPESSPGARRALSELEDMAGSELAEQAYLFSGPRAVRHLFEVAAGLDSLVVGETEIMGQVKGAYEAARALGMTGRTSNVLFQRALFVGKKVRNDTKISAGQTSVASVAVQLAHRIFGDLSQSSVLILGAGAMAELTATHLSSSKVMRLSIANRTWERAVELAGRFSARPLRWEDFPSALVEADIVVASTGSPEPIVTRAMVVELMRRRSGRSLFLIDIAMPRDVEESVHGLEHVYLYRLEDLEGIVADNLRNRGGEVERARALVHEKAAEFCAGDRREFAGQAAELRHSEAL